MMKFGHGLVAVDEASATAVATILWWLWDDAHASLGMVIVDPAHRSRGLGRQLMQTALDEIGGRAVLLHATESGVPLYKGLGFRRLGIVEQWQGDLNQNAPGPAASAFPVAEFIERDSACFGAGRSPLLTELCRTGDIVATKDKRAVALVRDFGRGRQIGPVLSDSVADALALLAALPSRGFHRIDVTDPIGAVQELLSGKGLCWVGVVVAMVRGHWPRSSRSFALLSQGYG